MKKIQFSAVQKDSLVSFLLVQLFALLFIAIFFYAVSLGSEITTNKKVIVQKEQKIRLK